MNGSIADVVFCLDQRHLLATTRQPEFQSSSFHVNGQVNMSVIIMNVGDQTERCSRAELNFGLQYLIVFLFFLIERFVRYDITQIRVTVKLRYPQFFLFLTTTTFVSPRATALLKIDSTQ